MWSVCSRGLGHPLERAVARRATALWFHSAEARRNAHLTPQQSALALWGGWTLTMAVFFSVAGFFHTYYLSMLAPGIAALAGIGLMLLWRDYRAAGLAWLGCSRWRWSVTAFVQGSSWRTTPAGTPG